MMMTMMMMMMIMIQIAFFKHQNYDTGQAGVRLPTMAVNATLPAFAAERRTAAQRLVASQLSIDISRRHGAQQQTRRTPRLLSNDGTDRRPRIDKYLDTLLASRTARKVKPLTSDKMGQHKMADCPSYY